MIVSIVLAELLVFTTVGWGLTERLRARSVNLALRWRSAARRFARERDALLAAMPSETTNGEVENHRLYAVKDR
jgi:hypothetical protein